MSRKFQCKVVPSQWLENNDRRLDCGPYMSGAIEARELLNKLSIRKDCLHQITTGIYHAGRESRLWVKTPEYGTPFMGSTSILASDLSNLPLISTKQVQKNPKFKIHSGWTLITRSGTIGRMAYARPDMDGLACSEHVMRVVPDDSKVQSGYIYAYLSSKFGVPLVISGTYGSIIQSIEPHHIADLPVPRLGDIENQVHKLVQKAADLLTKYQSNINEATKLFFESVGLEDITATEWHEWGADVGFTSTANAKSFRALNYNPRFNRLCERIKKGSWKSLSDVCVAGSLKRGGRYRRIEAEPEHSYLMINQKQIFWLRPEGKWIAKSCVDDDVVVNIGSTLIAGAGTLADSECYSRCEFIWGEAVNKAYSELFYRVQADENKLLPGALFSFMRSEMAFRMLRSISFGSKLQYPHAAFLPNLPVPYPDKKTIEITHNLIVSAYEMKDEEIRLEDQARTLVEQAIEQAAT